MEKGYFFVKRAFDVVASLLGIIVISPVWVITVIGILFPIPDRFFIKQFV